MIPILEHTVRAGPFQCHFLIRHRSTQRLNPIYKKRVYDTVKEPDPSRHRYYTKTRILAAAIGIATLLRNNADLISVALDNKHYDARHRTKPGPKQEHRKRRP